MAKYISLREAKETLRKVGAPTYAINALSLVKPVVNMAPVVPGRWHDVYLIEPWIATGICSQCDVKSYVNPDYLFALRCPNCGARMDGADE